MSDSKSIRIRTTPGTDKNVSIKLEHNFDFLEVLSLKISQEDVYRSFCANYGAVVGRVFSNKGLGLPNAKVSVFIPISDEDEKNDLIRDLYPFKSPVDKDKNFIRYNLLLSKTTCNLNKPVGTFPTKEEVLGDDIVLEIYDKYYKYTTKTNASGDFMLFGVPTGERTLHMDVDISDISLFSVRPYDLIANGAPENLFDSNTEFKVSTNIDELPQVISENKTIDVIPFWGDPETCELGITRLDFDTGLELKTNAIFMGSVFTDNGKNDLNKRCNPKNDLGDQGELRTGAGTIEMIRANRYNPEEWVNNSKIEATELETFSLKGGDLIDEDGVFVYTLPMNVGHIKTNEFGEIVPSEDPSVGIATKGYYRFKMAFSEPPANRKRRTANMLFPSLSEKHGGSKGYVSSGNVDDIGGTEDQRFTDNIGDYKDPDKDFHLFEWKHIYTIAQYLKKYKKGSNRFSFLGLKNTDVNGSFNLLPFNTAVYKVDIIFLLLSFFVDIAALFIRVLIVLAYFSITIRIRFRFKFTVLGKSFGFSSCFKTPEIRPFSFLEGLIPESLNCDGEEYYTGVSCGPDSEGCDELTENGIDLDFIVYAPDDDNCSALEELTKWKCCSKLQLALQRNVIRLSLFDTWIFGTSYLFQYRYKSRPKNDGTIKEKFCGPGSDTPGGNNYHKNQCCPHGKESEGNECPHCLIRGANTTKERNWGNIENYHYTWHNATVNGDCDGQSCGNGATDIGDNIYCNSYMSTKIIGLGRIEMCPDILRDINKCINSTSCTLNKYEQNGPFYTGTDYEEGFDPDIWSESFGLSSYQDPKDVIRYLLLVRGCDVNDMFNNEQGCHEKEFNYGVADSGSLYEYQVIKEVSKLFTEIKLDQDEVEDRDGNIITLDRDGFDPSKIINLEDDTGSGFIYDIKYGQRFHPCVDDNNCLPPPNNWAPTRTLGGYAGLLVSDAQSIADGPDSTHNASKNAPYYYFGLIPGKTAIEKLRKNYFVPKNRKIIEKNPFI